MTPKEWRESRKLKRHEVAKLLGCSPMSVFNYETGRRTPPLKIALKYGEISDKKVTPDDLSRVRLRTKTRKAA